MVASKSEKKFPRSSTKTRSWENAPLAPSVLLHEPAGALFAGPEGLDDYRILLPSIPLLLSPGGVAVVEIGAEQADAVAGIATGEGLGASLHHDLAGRARALVLRQGVWK